MPFDTAVSYRPGARFGPRGIRAGSSRQTSFRSFNPILGINPYLGKTKIIDCGDVELTPFDNAVAYAAMQEAYADLLARDTPRGADSVASLPGNGRAPLALDGKAHPRIATLGGDHSIVLPILRALHAVYGPITVLHWDSHLDSWAPAAYGKASQSAQSGYNHGTMVRPSLSMPSLV
jgi:agmatinase